MRGRLVLLLLLVGAFLCVQPLQMASAQVVVTTSLAPPVELGYSPGSLNTIANGVPVYTTGDSLWVMSTSSTPFILQLSNPNGSVLASGVINPQAPIDLYTFPPSAVSGTWALTEVVLQTAEASGSIPLLVVDANSVALSMTGYALSSDGNLSMTFTTAPSNAYDFLACSVGGQPPDTLSIPLPGALGTGNMQVTMNGSSVEITAKGAVSSPFSFWVELHQDYSYTDGSSSTVVSRDMEVASSTAIPISPGSNATSSPITAAVNMRPGLFTLRAFFDSSSGLSAATASVLIPGNSSTWIPLSSCSASSKNPSPPFTLSSRLGSSTQTWPTQVYLTYLEDGVEMYSVTTVRVQPAALAVVASKWDAPLTDSELTFHPGPGVQQSATADGTIYLTATQYPLTIGVSILKGEVQSVVIPSPYSYVTLELNASRLVVDTLVAGDATPGAAVVISTGNTTISLAKSGFGGVAEFYLPPGSYNITGTFDNMTRTAGVLAQENGSSVVTLNFAGCGGPGSGLRLRPGRYGCRRARSKRPGMDQGVPEQGRLTRAGAA